MVETLWVQHLPKGALTHRAEVVVQSPDGPRAARPVLFSVARSSPVFCRIYGLAAIMPKGCMAGAMGRAAASSDRPPKGVLRSDVLVLRLKQR